MTLIRVLVVIALVVLLIKAAPILILGLYGLH